MKSGDAMKLKIAILLLLFMGLLAAEWAEIIRVELTTLKGYPVANATVFVNYQRNIGVFSEYFVAIPGQSSANCEASKVTITDVIIDPVTGQAELVTQTTQGSCSLGAGWIEPGEDTPPGLSPGSLGVSGPWNVIAQQKPIDLRRLDGVVRGKTNASGVFEAPLNDYVSSGEVRQYLVSVGTESRAVNFGENMRNRKHVEMFIQEYPIAMLQIRTTDGDGRMLANVSLSGSCPSHFEAMSDELGSHFIYLPEDSACSFTGRYETLEASLSYSKITDGMCEFLKLPIYDLNLLVVDDSGNPLPGAQIDVPGYPAGQTDGLGLYMLRHFLGAQATVGITYGNRHQISEVQMTSSDQVITVFDFTPPIITDINVTLNSSTGIARVRARIYDKSVGTSEIVSPSVRYSLDKKSWKKVRMYQVSAATYEAFLPEQAEGTEVFFTVEAADKYANKATSPISSYVVPTAGGGGVTIPSAGSITIFGIQISNLIIITVVVIGALLIYRYKIAQ